MPSSKIFLSELWSYIKSPYYVLRAGHFKVLTFILLSAFISIEFASLLNQIQNKGIIEIAAKQSLPSITVVRLHQFSNFLSWLVVAPILLLSVMLPVRIVYIYNSLPLGKLFWDIGHALRTAIQALLKTYISVPIYFVPLVFLILSEGILQEVTQDDNLLYAYYILTAIIALATVIKIVPILVMPFVAVAGLYETPIADLLSKQLYQDKMKEYFIFLLLLIAIMSLLTYLLPPNIPFRLGYYLLIMYLWGYAFGGFVVHALAILEASTIKQTSQSAS